MMRIRAAWIALISLWGTGPLLWAGSVVSPYWISAETDFPLAGSAAALQVYGQYRLARMDTGLTLTKADLFPWDRPFAGVYRPWADRASDILLGFGVFPIAISLGAWYHRQLSGECALAQIVMLAELLTLQSGINLTMRSLRIWPRPFIWKPGAGGRERSEGQAYGSFYSGHAGGSFAAAVFTAIWFERQFPNSIWSARIWWGGLIVASAISGLRVAAGKHYPTDVIAGALIGSASAMIVLRLHENRAEESRLQMVLVPGKISALWSF